MSILQISKIQVRTGNLVDLPQLDEGEFGLATDAKRVFIGKTTPNENIEILTAYSQIDFNQINGAEGNININSVTLDDGQVFVYDGNNWVNRGGDAGGLITLGDVSDVKLDGGAIGYVLETDGLGNLSWTPKSTIIANIENVTQSNTAVLTTEVDNFFTDGLAITITDAPGMTELNGNTYYVDILTSNTAALFTDAGLTTPLDTGGYNAYAYTSVANTTISTNVIDVGNAAVLTVNTPVRFLGDVSNTGIENGITYYVKARDTGANTITISNELLPNGVAGNVVPLQTTTGLSANVYQQGGRAISTVAAGGGSASAGGANTMVQINNNNLLDGDSDFTYDFGSSPKLLTLNGNANVGNLNATGIVSATRLFSNISTGTTPIQVSSTTRVPNLNVSYSNVTDFSVVTARTTGTFYPILSSGSSTANYALGANANLTFNAATGNLGTTLLNVSSNANIGNLGVGGAIIVVGNITAAAGTITGNLTVGNILSNGTIGGANATLFGNSLTTGANADPGTITGNWTLIAGSRLEATYADLAEYYTSDENYEPGTVVEFGGLNEVTLATNESNKVAGVISSNPAYLMNSSCEGVSVPVALQGRVPCKVIGSGKKGDMMVSAGNGCAKSMLEPKIGTIIGKSLLDFNESMDIIEIAVGRL